MTNRMVYRLQRYKIFRKWLKDWRKFCRQSFFMYLCPLKQNKPNPDNYEYVDGDGKDEVLFGSAAIDDNGQLLYATGFGHGDAIHVGKMRPDDKGFQVFQVHEESPYGWDLHDAATGKVLFRANADDDNGRGIAADVIASNPGWEFCSSKDRQQRSAVTGQVVTTKSSSVNFRLYWDGTLQDCLADGGYTEAYSLTHWNGSSFAGITSLEGLSCNTTKRNPNLLCDLLGDWREEVILHDGNKTLYIHSSAMPTNYKVPCLLTDHTYRMGIAWQMSSYNQPPHLGYHGNLLRAFQHLWNCCQQAIQPG